MIENQLFAPTLKGVIDFGCGELIRKQGSVLRNLLGKGLMKIRSGARQSQNQRGVMHDYRYLFNILLKNQRKFIWQIEMLTEEVLQKPLQWQV